MGIFDYLIIGTVVIALIAAIRFLKKNGAGCGGCVGDCSSCSKRKK